MTDVKKVEKKIQNLDWLRKEIIGRNMMFDTCFGKKPLVYADYTASGRNLEMIENHMLNIMKYYANTHTEDDYTGRVMTILLHEAETRIKNLVNAGKKGKVIFTESGSTGGIAKLQQILGVFWPPATKKRVDSFLNSCLDRYPERGFCTEQLRKYIADNKPIVFVGPYEHHSNEIMWRKTLCEVIEIPLNENGYLDLIELERIVSDPLYKNRQKIGSFSAASNVSGIRTKVYDVARILHKHNAIACFDFAACAPYIEINMNKDKESYFDAVFFSPHKFLGGPGTSGILIFNEDIYPKGLSPTVAAGGTVDFVSSNREKFTDDIEKREKPGTPGILQAIKIALVMELKAKIGVKTIEDIEEGYLERFYDIFKDNDKIQLLGPVDKERKIGIIPFNIPHRDRILHPKFVTKLMNDLFGVQTRAGCSCAGPYGHQLLNINDKISKYYQCVVGVDKITGLKPGWVRFNLHYSLSEAEFQYIVNILKFIIEYGHLFLPYYVFDFKSGDWYHLESHKCVQPIDLNIDNVLKEEKFTREESINDEELYSSMISEAKLLVKDLKEPEKYPLYDKSLEELMFFYVLNWKNKK